MIRQVVNREHPTVGRIHVRTGSFTLWMKNGQQKHVVTVQRNDPCPCGSGKKFKKCHG